MSEKVLDKVISITQVATQTRAYLSPDVLWLFRVSLYP